MRTYRKSAFLTFRGIWLQCAALFKHAVKSACGECVDYCRRFLSTRITLTDSAPSYIWQQVSQRVLSICVTIFWLLVLIHSLLVKLVSHCFCVHFSLTLSWWVFVACSFLLNFNCSMYLQKQLLNLVLLHSHVLKFGWHESTNLLLSFLILLIWVFFLLSGTLWTWGWDIYKKFYWDVKS